MTEKQKRFCDEYLIDLNATQAAVRAGYSKKTAKSIGQKLLTKVDLHSYIEEQLEVVRTSKTAEVAEILEYLTSVMRGESKSQAVISSPLGAELIDKQPDEKDKLKAAEMLGRYYGLFKEKRTVSGDMEFHVVFDYGDKETNLTDTKCLA